MDDRRDIDRDLEALIAGRAAETVGVASRAEDYAALSQSPVMLAVLATASMVAAGWRAGRGLRRVVTILGESGVGKEWLARLISRWSEAPAFHALNMAGISPSLVESELFGHERGAYTGATVARDGHLARDGVLLLDEVGKAPREVLDKLLRALRAREYYRVGGRTLRHVKARVICATSEDLRAMTRAGDFPLDFWNRIGGLVLDLPPLRSRKEDIGVIAQAIAQAIADNQAAEIEIDHEAVTLLSASDWRRGNVAELEDAISNAWWLHGEVSAERLAEYVTVDRRSREEVLLAMAARPEGVTNREARDRLDVSKWTVARMISEMAAAGRIVEMRPNRRDVIYRTPEVFIVEDHPPVHAPVLTGACTGQDRQEDDDVA